jgi:hypothetical protein
MEVEVEIKNDYKELRFYLFNNILLYVFID